MDNKKPGVFANKIDKQLTNNMNVDYSKNEERSVDVLDNKKNINPSSQNINQKISSIFNSSRYVYKAEVTIKTKDKTINKKIVGKNGNNIITIENELIPISEIIDIDFSN